MSMYLFRVRIRVPASDRASVCVSVCVPASDRVSVCVPASDRVSVCVPASDRASACVAVCVCERHDQTTCQIFVYF
jgi:hypothetical protein